jgi:hypothetical protein
VLRLGRLGVWLTYEVGIFDKTADWILLHVISSFYVAVLHILDILYHHKSFTKELIFSLATCVLSWKHVKEFRHEDFFVIRSYNAQQCSFRYTLSCVIKVLLFSILYTFVIYACPFEFRIFMAVLRPSVHCERNSGIIFDSLQIK